MSAKFAAKTTTDRAHAEVKMLKVQNCRTITNAPSASFYGSRSVFAHHEPAGACIAVFLSADNLPYRKLAPHAGIPLVVRKVKPLNHTVPRQISAYLTSRSYPTFELNLSYLHHIAKAIPVSGVC
jgi:hypothetical protein